MYLPSKKTEKIVRKKSLDFTHWPCDGTDRGAMLPPLHPSMPESGGRVDSEDGRAGAACRQLQHSGEQVVHLIWEAQ